MELSAAAILTRLILFSLSPIIQRKASKGKPGAAWAMFHMKQWVTIRYTLSMYYTPKSMRAISRRAALVFSAVHFSE